jgi:DNA repair protein RecO (recombination protein O)
MSLLVTDAVVLHAFDYMETSRIYRLLTREAGVQSALARGARRPRSRFGVAVDLFAGGEAQLSFRATRDLQTLTAFDVTEARPLLAASLERFTAAAMIAELVLQFSREDAQPALFDTLCRVLDGIAEADENPTRASERALGGAWRIVAELGFTPSIDVCSSCHDEVPRGEPAVFSHAAGGVLCIGCSAVRRGTRLLPPEARDGLRLWLNGDDWASSGEADVRAHQRLLREFLTEHLSDGRVLRAFEVWERGDWLGRCERPAPAEIPATPA